MAQLGGAKFERPLNVEQIISRSTDSFFDEQFSMKQWFRTANVMLKQAGIYEHEGNDQMAFFLLYRHAHLVVNDLPKHQDAKDPQHKQSWAQARKVVGNSMNKLEVLKPRINQRHERYQEKLRSRQTSLNAAAEGSPLGIGASESGSTEILSPEAHEDIAVSLANHKVAQRAARTIDVDLDTFVAMQRARRQTDNASVREATSTSKNIYTSYNYPSVPAKGRQQQAPYEPMSLHSTLKASPPTLPSKEYNNTQAAASSSVEQVERPPPIPSKFSSTLEPSHPFGSSSQLESGEPLRTIFLPSPLRHEFLKLAAENTARNLETCGMLCGTLMHNAFFITHLVVPEQTSTSDTCEMTNEASLDAFIDEQSSGDPTDVATQLMVLGWIHTHPSQTCFMSSRDLHTHVWYQVQLPESIAIVCAPSQPSPNDWGVFRLTDPPGMQAVRTCKAAGIFHPHQETRLFTDALGRPGHVIEHGALKFGVIDLRT